MSAMTKNKPWYIIQNRYSAGGLWSLFLVCAFPLHAWAIILSLRDFNWVAERTNTWDAVGVISYALVFAFVESIIIFLLFTLAGWLISTKWNEPHRITLLGFLILVLASWSIFNQSHFIWGASLPGIVRQLALASEHPVRIIYLYLLVLVGLTVLVPTILILRNHSVFRLFQSLFERVAVLTSFYLVFDLIGLLIVVSRNV